MPVIRKRLLAGVATATVVATPLSAQTLTQPPPATPAQPQPGGTAGPYHVDLPVGGDEFDRDLAGAWRIGGDRDWTLSAWFSFREAPPAPVLIAGVGETGTGAYLAASRDRIGIWNGRTLASMTVRPLTPGWHLLSAVGHAGDTRLYLDGRPVMRVAAPPAFDPTRLRIGPRGLGGFAPFGGKVADVTLRQSALDPAVQRTLAARVPRAELIRFDTGSPTWPLQVTNMTGLTRPQEPWTLPRASTPPDRPVAVPPYAGPALVATGQNRWTLARWQLASAREVAADGAALSRPGEVAGRWRAATVPGTVLTTLVDRGVYPDPTRGLNNLAIPDDLGRQDWWYRSEFDAPAALPARQELVLDGINYTADIWLNGERLGGVAGAFTRGRFDVTGKLKSGRNALAVLIHPPRHPGTPHEQSLAAGWGPNGGLQALDGPTFFASEGWDWIPGIRDRNIGLWQGVSLIGSGALTIGDPQIVTALPRPDNSEADVEIIVPVRNATARPVSATVSARFDDVGVSRTVTAAPGETVVRFSPQDSPQLAVRNPKLWWPNGYGEPALHTAHLSVAADGVASDTADVRFGMRQVTYELSLMNPAGAVRRVEADFTRARGLGQQVLDVRHEGIRKVPGGWVESLTAAGDASPAVTPLADARLAPFLVLKVNGVRIAARGGSWGTDDLLKRSSRERLEPFFRLHRDAGVNMIRNWVGQNTEPAFFDLADEYGLLVTNDFWASTQDYQMEPEDVPLFLANAQDTIARYRNHPSIAFWVGRNEGVPQPVLNEGLERLVRTLDGTRWYTGSSNSVNLWYSGPYNYREPQDYFTKENKGFAVEVGSPSFPTLEAFEAAVPPSERWPISDTWAYHDWHRNGNGETGSFLAAMTAKLGAPTGLADFERKAQLMNFEDYRAIMEGMNAELWTKTSGRLLWMTQPAWPSTMWQIMSHDGDTHASFFGFKAAAEPVHVQMTLPDHRVQLLDNRTAPITGARVTARVVALDGRALVTAQATANVAAQQVAEVMPLDLAPVLAAEGAVVVALDAADARGAPLSHNLYWVARDAQAMRKLSTMPAQDVTLTATRSGQVVTALVRNTGATPALNVKLTLLGADGMRILPAYWSDNYLSLLPGERRTVTVRFDRGTPATLTLRGWNAREVRAPIP